MIYYQMRKKELFQVSDNYQQSLDGVIRVDLKKGIIVDENDDIMKIQKRNGEFAIMKEEDGIEKEATQAKSYQKTLTTSKNTIYSN